MTPPSPGRRRRVPLVARLRGGLGLAWLVPLTAVLLPVQMLAVPRGWRLAATLPVWWHRQALKALDIRVTAVGAPAASRPLLVTPNHVSWLDILTIGSVMPLSFVAKAEVARWPLFGLFARLQRSVFVDRARRSDTGRVTGEMASRLAGGEAIVLFPEGTSSNGTHVLPFRSSLLGAARAALADAGAPVLVQPLAISVTHIDGLPAGRAERPRVAWYGDMEMLPHLLGVIASGPIDIELRWGEPVAFEAKTDRKALARRLEGEVRRLMTAARGGPSAGPHG